MASDVLDDLAGDDSLVVGVGEYFAQRLERDGL